MRPAIKATIDRLLAQYHEYMVLDTLCRDAKSAYEKLVLQLATELSLKPTQVLA